MAGLRTLVSFGRSRRTEAALLCGILALALVLGGGAWRSVDKLTDFLAASTQSRYYAQVVEGLETVLGDVLLAESEQRGYIVTADVTYLTTYDQALVQVREGFARLLKLTENDARLHPQIAELQRIAEKRTEYLADGIHLHRTGSGKRANEFVQMGRPLSLATRTRFAQIQSQYQTALAQTREQAQVLRADTIQAFAVTSGIAAVVLAFMAIMVVVEARFIRALSERMLHASRHDELTALPNRAYLNEWLERGIAAARRSNEKLGLLYLDLNGFKQVNDALGHKAGDEVLIEIGRRLQATARDADFVARLGGDEFAVIMPRIADRSQAEAAAQRFSAMKVEEGPHVVGASVGSAVYPDDADSAQALMQVGDAAMYARKQARRR